MSFRYKDLFPFCITDVGEVPVGVGTNYPFAMSLEDVMAFYWKVRTFKFYGSYNFSFDYNNGSPQSAYINDTFNSTVNPEFYWPEKMSQMICQNSNPEYSPFFFYSPFFYGTTSGTGTITTTVIGSTSNTVTFAELHFFNAQFVSTSPFPLGKKDGFYYPYFTVSISTDYEYGSGYSSFKPDPGATFTTATNMLSLIVNGKTYSTDFYAGRSSLLPSTNLNFSGSLIVEEKDARLAE